MASTYHTQIQKLYVAYFNRPADFSGLNFWENTVEAAAAAAGTDPVKVQAAVDASLKQIAVGFSKSAEYTAEYAGLDIPHIIGEVYQNLFSHGPDLPGLLYWEAEMRAGRVTIADAVVSIAAGAQGTDKVAFDNKVKAAVAFTNALDTGAEVLGYSGAAALSAAKLFIDGITTDATLAAAIAPAALDATVAGVVAAGTPVQPSVTIALTNGADAATGGAGNDLFIASEASLSSADVLTGGNGTDTLRYASSGNTAVNESGFAATSVEVVSVTSDATGGTTFDVTGVSGLTTIINDNSSTDVTFEGLGAVSALKMSNVSAGNTNVNYKSTAVAGAGDTQAISLSGNTTNANGAVGSLTVNGVETIAISTSGGESKLASIASNSLKAMTVSGDASLSINTLTFTDNVNVNTLDAKGLTGTAALNVTIAANTATLDVAVTGGAGNDRADFSTGFDTKDAFVGGAGRDTLAVTQAVATAQTAATGGTINGVEILEITNGGTGAISMDNFVGADTVFYSGLNGAAALAGAVSITNAVTGITVRDNVDAVAQNITVALKTNGTADVANFAFDKVGTADAIGALSAAEFETVNIVTSDDAAVLDTGVVSIASATLTAATTLNISGNASLTITDTIDPAVAVLGTIDASTATGKVSIAGTNLKASGATVTFGSGDDTFTVATAAGADTFDMTKGGKDKVVYNAVAQSSSANTDVIKGFTSGSDVIDLTATALLGAGVNGAGVADSTQFVGVKATFGEAQGALLGNTGANKGQSAVFDSSTGILWVDSDSNGTLDNNDFRIKLEGVTTITAADIGLAAAAGAAVTLSATSADVSTTTKVGANVSTTAFNDTITTTLAFLPTATINGATGTDTLVLTTAGAVAVPATVTNVESLTLATVASTGNGVAAFSDLSVFANITGSANADTLASTGDMIEGGSIALGAGNDVITALNLFETIVAGAPSDTSYKFNVDMGAGDDTVTQGTALTLTADSVLAGGAGSDTLNLAAGANIAAGNVTGFETITLAGAATMTRAQYAQATAVNGAFVVTFADAGAVATSADSGTVAYQFAAGGNAMTVNGAVNYAITGGAGVDSVTFAAGWTSADSVDLGVGTNDTVTIGHSVTGGVIDTATVAAALVNVENLVIGAQAAAFALTLDAQLVTVDASAAVSATTVAATTAAMTSLKLGAGNDTITSLVTGASAFKVESGAGNLTITDITTHGAGAFTLAFAAPAAGTTVSATVAATTANFAIGDVFDFATAVTGVVSGAVNGVNGVAGAIGQVFVEHNGGNSIITFDADGSRTFSAGDVQITIVGNVVTGGIDASGNFLINGTA